MTAFLINEMLPPATAQSLRRLRHDAQHLSEVGLTATGDDVVEEATRSEGRALVTDYADWADEADLVLVFVRGRTLPSGGAMAEALALLLDRWSGANAEPYIGAHWPI